MIYPTNKDAARERIRQYEASMAIEGLYLSEEGRSVIESCIADGLNRDQSTARIIESLKARGIIPTDSD